MAKSFEERKECLIVICDKHLQLANYKEQILATKGDEKLNELILQMQKTNADLSRQILQCSNTFTEENPYRH